MRGVGLHLLHMLLAGKPSDNYLLMLIHFEVLRNEYVHIMAPIAYQQAYSSLNMYTQGERKPAFLAQKCVWSKPVMMHFEGLQNKDRHIIALIA